MPVKAWAAAIGWNAGESRMAFCPQPADRASQRRQARQRKLNGRT